MQAQEGPVRGEQDVPAEIITEQAAHVIMPLTAPAMVGDSWARVSQHVAPGVEDCEKRKRERQSEHD